MVHHWGLFSVIIMVSHGYLSWQCNKKGCILSLSSTTVLLTFQKCDERINIDCRISRFMLATWTNINLEGTALYEVAAVIFIAQLNQISLNFSQLITIGYVNLKNKSQRQTHKKNKVHDNIGRPFLKSAVMIPVLKKKHVVCLFCSVTAAASGAARMPTTGAMTTLFVLTVMGLPTKDVSFLVAVECLL